MQKRISTLAGILIILAAAVVLVGGAFLIMQNAKIKYQNDSAKIQNETADWKTYANTEYGFEIKYPSYLTAGKLSENSSVGNAYNKVPGIFVGPLLLVVLTNKDMEAEAEKFFHYYYSPNENNSGTLNNGSTQIEYVYLEGDGGPAYYAFIKNSNKSIFVERYNSDGGNKKNEIIREIISTFKFTK